MLKYVVYVLLNVWKGGQITPIQDGDVTIRLPEYLRIIVLSLTLYNMLFFNVFVVFSEINIFSHSINSSNLFYNAF